ncbi:hypothetical protein [Acinetobacter sp. ABJ_C5_2]|uniref:hypothetical protein n=1 Tax=Acinetobacter sp. ABJ_C5_2 TaxID=3376992 RepID=UPI0037CAB5EC
MNTIEVETVIECEKIKGKAAIAVAILNHACSGTAGLTGVNENARNELVKFIREAQKTLDE